MADKTIGELPSIPDLYDDSLIPVEQQGVASKMTGRQFADFGREAAARDVQRAIDAADAAEKSRDGARAEANRAEELRESIKVDYEALHKAVSDAETHADRAKDEADRSKDSAALSESWAVGGTGARQGENTNNSKYWADQAQSYEEQAGTRAETVYNVVLGDIATGDKYVLIVEDGRLALLGVPEELSPTSLLLIDHGSGVSYAVAVENGRLRIEEAV